MKKLLLLLLLIPGFIQAQITVPQGGSGITSVPIGNIVVGSTAFKLTSTSSPTVGYITATSTTATSTFPYAEFKGANATSSQTVGRTYPLRILGGLNDNAGLIAERTDAAADFSLWTGSSGAVLQFSDNLSRWAIGTNPFSNRESGNFPAQEYLSLLLSGTNAGNLGIGTVAPTVKLEVVGTASSSILSVSSPTATSSVLGNLAVGTSSVSNPFATGNARLEVDTGLTANVGLRILGGTGASGNKLEVYSTANALQFLVNNNGAPNWNNGASGNTLTISSANTSSVPLGLTIPAAATVSAYPLTISKTGVTQSLLSVNSAGNVGIGTTTSTAQLAVENIYGQSTSTTLFYVASTTSANGSTANKIFSIESSGTVSLNTPATTNNLLSLDAPGRNFIITPDDTVNFAGLMGMTTGHPLSIITNNVSRLTISSGGNVGIGTTTPVGKLEVTGGDATNAALVLSPANVSNSKFISLDTPGPGQVEIASVQNSAGIVFNMVNSANGFKFLSSLFGVGTTTPFANFQATNMTANSTTTIEFGTKGQNKGTCIKMYDETGIGWYLKVTPGGSLSVSATNCASVAGF